MEPPISYKQLQGFCARKEDRKRGHVENHAHLCLFRMLAFLRSMKFLSLVSTLTCVAILVSSPSFCLYRCVKFGWTDVLRQGDTADVPVFNARMAPTSYCLIRHVRSQTTDCCVEENSRFIFVSVSCWTWHSYGLWPVTLDRWCAQTLNHLTVDYFSRCISDISCLGYPYLSIISTLLACAKVRLVTVSQYPWW